jgi:superfamily II DNA or RNA helicase
MLQRFSSRRESLDHSFLKKRLAGAASYDRIAGYFRASILEIAGEELEAISGKVRVVCNSDICKKDMETLFAADLAQRRSWCEGSPEELPPLGKERALRLYHLVTSGKIEIRILPDDVFGLIHGKAGIIRYEDRQPTCFLGSVNESRSSWQKNYELVWEDSSYEAVCWVQEEFDSLWQSRYAYPLCQFVIDDLKRIANRQEVSKKDWDEESSPGPVVVESKIYRKELGLWPHQQYFVKRVFDEHKESCARLLLADQVGLGKTIQLAFSAQLIALLDEAPVLIMTPKALIFQWFDELRDLFGLPCALWTGKCWIDEVEKEYRVKDHPLNRCPRKIGIVSYELIIHSPDARAALLSQKYSCIVVDEAHKARRKKTNLQKIERPSPENCNNLMQFLHSVSTKTKSMLLATATPVQIHPIEAWDLLWILAHGNDKVLGNRQSQWCQHPQQTLDLVTRKDNIPHLLEEAWHWVRNPLPSAREDGIFDEIRRRMKVRPTEHVLPVDGLDQIPTSTKTKLSNYLRFYCDKFNPFIRHIILRKREYLEKMKNPVDNMPYLQPIKVELYGEKDDEAIRLHNDLMRAYVTAQQFCQSLKSRVRSSGFMETMLLRRIGSSVHAGTATVRRLLESNNNPDADDEEEDDEDDETSTMYPLSEEEKGLLHHCLSCLVENSDSDPKFKHVKERLISDGWLEDGCIIFSQYFDSIDSLAEYLAWVLPYEPIGIYAGNKRSSIRTGSIRQPCDREKIKQKVSFGELRLVLGTDAASEGLNLQKLGSLINLDLPWNPTRLEQRKGRIQRIGQVRSVIRVYNMRYRGSVEDQVHKALSNRLSDIHTLFGQIPDTLKDVWIDAALGKKELDLDRRLQTVNPFDDKYAKVECVDWNSCTKVLSQKDIADTLKKGW